MYSMLIYFLPNTNKSVSDKDSLPARAVPSSLTAYQCSERRTKDRSKQGGKCDSGSDLRSSG